jgi:biotin synthase
MNNSIQLIEKASRGKGLLNEEALYLLNTVPTKGDLFLLLLKTANRLTRQQFNNTAEIHAQIGLNWDTCSNSCQFCYFSEDLKNVSKKRELSEAEVIEKAKEFESYNVGSISLMATADFDFDKYLNISRTVRKHVKTVLFGNHGDLTIEMAREIKKVGFSFYYHALRLGEGKVTKLEREKRLLTMSNARRVGLLVGSCLEPIGPEHSYEEIISILDEMRNQGVAWMATMKRISVSNSPLNSYGEISDEEFAKITAVTRLYYGNKIIHYGCS